MHFIDGNVKIKLIAILAYKKTNTVYIFNNRVRIHDIIVKVMVSLSTLFFKSIHVANITGHPLIV